MILALDAVRIAARDPDSAARAYRALLGFEPEAGGRRFGLDNTALEIVAAPGEGEGLSGLVFAVDTLADTRDHLARRGLASEPAADGARADLDAAATGGVAMALVEAAASTPPAHGAEAVTALDHVVIRTQNPDRAVALYGARLGLDFRLDRSNPQWGSRLLFFRCGGATLEVASSLQPEAASSPDRLDGLAWRVADVAAAHARLSGEALNISEVRTGRKPGTAVFTLRAGVIGAPALVIGPG